jgi:hypothetical protein
MASSKPAQSVPVKDYITPDFIKENPRLAAALSKMVPSRIQLQRDASGQRMTPVMALAEFEKSAAKRIKANRDSTTVLKLLPDLEIAVQILVSSLCSPGDLVSTDLTYTSNPDLFTSDTTAALIDIVKDYFEKEHPLKKDVPVMLRRMVAETGSYPVAVIPENALDALINGPMEILAKESAVLDRFLDSNYAPKPLGILGPGLGAPPPNKRNVGLVMEAFKTGGVNAANVDSRIAYEGVAGQDYLRDEFVTVTDNLAALKMPRLLQNMRAAQHRKVLESALGQMSMESLFKINDNRIEATLYKGANGRVGSVQMASALPQQHELTRKSVGKPLVVALPSEAVMPVYTPGDVTKHIGAFVLLDEEGYPLNATDDADFAKHAKSSAVMQSKSSMTSNLLNKLNSNMSTGQNIVSMQEMQVYREAPRLYGDMVEKDLIARIKNGIHGAGVKISSNDDIYRLMMARTLEGRYTQLLYIPGEYLTYMTFKYNKTNGMGKSLLDDVAPINAMRAVLEVSDVFNAVRNSVGRTDVNVTLPEDDPDGTKTLEVVKDYIVQSNHINMPWSIESQWDITNFLQRAAYRFNVEGGGLPDLKYETSQSTTSYPRADADLSALLRKLSFMGLGVPMEMVDQAEGPEFASVARSNNVLFSKRIITLQDTFDPQLSDHVKKIIRNTGDLIEAFLNVVRKKPENIKMVLSDEEANYLKTLQVQDAARYKINRAVAEFINHLKITLPKPPSVTVKSQTDELGDYIDFVDKALDAGFINDKITTDAVSGEIDKAVARVKAYLVRRFMTEHNIGNELFDLVATGEDGKPQVSVFEEALTHTKALVRTLVTSQAITTPVDQAAAADMETLGQEPGSSGSTSNSNSSSGTEDTAGSDVGDLGSAGGDDLFSDGGSTGSSGTEDTAGSEKTPQEDKEEPSAGGDDLFSDGDGNEESAPKADL